MSQEVQVQNVYQIVEMQEETFKSVQCSDDTVWQKESQFAIQALQANDTLNKIAWNNRASLQNAIINVASIGISLNPAKKHAYLVPRDKKVCLDISYMGLMHLAIQSGSILWGQAKLVYANDDYKNTGIDKAPSHIQNTFGDKGEIIGAYCTVKTPSNDYLTEEMDIKALNKVRASSKAANGPWKTWFDEMCRKTVVKRGSKYWPCSDRLDTAVAMLNQDEGLNEVEIKDVYSPPCISEEQKQELLGMIGGNPQVIELAAEKFPDLADGLDNILASSFTKARSAIGRAEVAIRKQSAIDNLLNCTKEEFFEQWEVMTRNDQNALYAKMTEEQQEKIQLHFQDETQ